MKTKTKEITIYVTDDGKEFTSENKALLHERELMKKDYIITYTFSGTYTTFVQATCLEEAQELAKRNEPYPEEIDLVLENTDIEEAKEN